MKHEWAIRQIHKPRGTAPAIRRIVKLTIGVIAVIPWASSFAAARPTSKQPVIEKIPEVTIHTCSDQDRNQTTDARVTVPVLLDYGFDVREGIWECTRLRTPWLQRGQVFSLRLISPQVDSGENVTLLFLGREPGLWVIPIYAGMVGYPNIPDEIHNKSAFNALLAENDIRPQTAEMWTSLAMLYLNMVGVEVHVADWKVHGEIMHGLRSSPAFFHKRRILPEVECERDQCTVTLNDTGFTSVTQRLTTWSLTFSVIKNVTPRLDDVENEVKPLNEFR